MIYNSQYENEDSHTERKQKWDGRGKWMVPGFWGACLGPICCPSGWGNQNKLLPSLEILMSSFSFHHLNRVLYSGQQPLPFDFYTSRFLFKMDIYLPIESSSCFLVCVCRDNVFQKYISSLLRHCLRVFLICKVLNSLLLFVVIIPRCVSYTFKGTFWIEMGIYLNVLEFFSPQLLSGSGLIGIRVETNTNDTEVENFEE